MTLVYNCNDDVVAAVFISGMQVTHSYKYLVKHKVIKMRDILTRAQKSIQIEDASQSSVCQLLPQASGRSGEIEGAT